MQKSSHALAGYDGHNIQIRYNDHVIRVYSQLDGRLYIRMNEVCNATDDVFSPVQLSKLICKDAYQESSGIVYVPLEKLCQLDRQSFMKKIDYTSQHICDIVDMVKKELNKELPEPNTVSHEDRILDILQQYGKTLDIINDRISKLENHRTTYAPVQNDSNSPYTVMPDAPLFRCTNPVPEQTQKNEIPPKDEQNDRNISSRDMIKEIHSKELNIHPLSHYLGTESGPTMEDTIYKLQTASNISNDEWTIYVQRSLNIIRDKLMKEDNRPANKKYFSIYFGKACGKVYDKMKQKYGVNVQKIWQAEASRDSTIQAQTPYQYIRIFRNARNHLGEQFMECLAEILPDYIDIKEEQPC